MIRALALIGLVAVAVVLQGTVLYQAAPIGVTIDLALLLTLWTAWRHGLVPGAGLGLWSGALIGAAKGTSVESGLLYAVAAVVMAVLASRTVVSAAVMGGAIALSLQGLQNVVQGSWQNPETVPWILFWHMLGMAVLVGLSEGAGRLRWPRRPRLKIRGGKAWTADWEPLPYAG